MHNGCELFDKMHKTNVVSWTTMIAGYALVGCGNEALKPFEQMKLSRTRPAHVNLLCDLSAWLHAGLIDEGCQYLKLYESALQYHTCSGALSLCR